MIGLAQRFFKMTMLVGMWLVLSGAEGSCFGTEEIECAQLDEAGCLSEDACKPVYGYPDGWYTYRGNQDCGYGLRCLVEPDVFLQCLSQEADPCAGLEELECLQRPDYCRPEYADCLGGDCDSPYQGCSPADGPAHTGCRDDGDCDRGERCEISCSDYVCAGVCIQEKVGCESDSDCPEGFYCEHYRSPDSSVCKAGTWMSYNPIQCVSTYWEADFEYQPGLYRECRVCCDDDDDDDDDDESHRAELERCLLRTFLSHMGVSAHDVRRAVWDEDVCQNCEICPRGYTLYALVAPYDEDDMLHFGFKPY
jgi:hypothetical protein